MASFFETVLLVAYAGLAIAAADCVFDRDEDFPEFPSLLMDRVSWTSILPVAEEGMNVVRISEGADVVVACPETSITAFGTDVVDAKCEWGKALNVGGLNYGMMELGCVSKLKETIWEYYGACTGGQEHIIGYNITGYSFYKLISLCFDHVLENDLVSKHVLRGAHVAASDGNEVRPDFRKGDGFFDVSPDDCYKIENQSQRMKDILGSSSIINSSSQHYFARGHMAPDADFLEEVEADATYYYINAVPQWQSFNNGNWKYLEKNVRDLAQRHGIDFEIHTGTYGILKLNNVDGYPVEIFLCETDRGVIPAPELTWKVIYNTINLTALAVLGANNPFLEEIPTPLCDDICSTINWITFDVNDIDAGAVYCCTVQEFASIVPQAPDYPNSTGILYD